MNKWLVIVVLAVIVVGVFVWVSNRDEPGLSPSNAVKKTTKTTQQSTPIFGRDPNAPNSDAYRVFGVE